MQPFRKHHCQRVVNFKKLTIMKKINYIALGFLSLSIAFASCKKEKETEDLFSTTETASNETAVLDAVESDFFDIISQPHWIDADIEQEPSLINDGISCATDLENPDANESMSGANGRTDAKPCNIVNCNHLFASLRLSDAQKLRLRRSWNAYNDCVNSSRRRLAALHQQIMNEYQMEYKKLERSYRAGKITKEEFARSIQKLRMQYQHKIKSLKERELLCKAITNCYRQYLENVKSILTPEQWNRYFQCVRKGMSEGAKRDNASGQPTGKRG
jgi:hypothetical protein